MGEHKDSSESLNYVLLATCGCVRGATAIEDFDARHTAKFVADGIKRGLSVEKWTTADVRARPWRCAEHKREGAKR